MKYITLLAAGVVLGILLAPDKGSKTRRKLANQFDDLKDKTDDLLDDMKSGFKSVKKEAKHLLG